MGNVEPVIDQKSSITVVVGGGSLPRRIPILLAFGKTILA